MVSVFGTNSVILWLSSILPGGILKDLSLSADGEVSPLPTFTPLRYGAYGKVYTVNTIALIAPVVFTAYSKLTYLLTSYFATKLRYPLRLWLWKEVCFQTS